MKVGRLSNPRKEAKIMPKLHRATSNFIQPIIRLESGIELVRPYAAAKLTGHTSQCIRYFCETKQLPFIWDGETELIFVDYRTFGEGGKFSEKDYRRNFPFLPKWSGRLTCPDKK
jgi:hypothetical protein